MEKVRTKLGEKTARDFLSWEKESERRKNMPVTVFEFILVQFLSLKDITAL